MAYVGRFGSIESWRMEMRLAFILLAHEKPELLRPLIKSILASGSDIFVHYDKNSPYDLEGESRTWDLSEMNGEIFFAKSVRIKWGEWSIIQATLSCFHLVGNALGEYDYFILISGSCMPIKPIKVLKHFLMKSGLDHIETVNSLKQRWVMEGIQNERWEQYHFLNWRDTPYLFSKVLKFQQSMGIMREMPYNLIPYIGSQWWCLRTSTIRTLLEYINLHKDILQFYKRTWVPDESFFQTLIGNLIPKNEVTDNLILKYEFSKKGIPMIYYDDHYEELLLEKKFFVRKVSHTSIKLKDKLSIIGSMGEKEFMLFSRKHLS